MADTKKAIAKYKRFLPCAIGKGKCVVNGMREERKIAAGRED
jgi:hypothetical protein